MLANVGPQAIPRAVPLTKPVDACMQIFNSTQSLI